MWKQCELAAQAKTIPDSHFSQFELSHTSFISVFVPQHQAILQRITSPVAL